MNAVDATVVRPPFSGVQYAVRGQALAWRERFPEDLILATDPEISAEPLPEHLRSPQRRIWWQQVRLPGVLRQSGAEHLLALAYTAPLRCPVPYTLEVHDTIALRRPELCSRANAWHMRALMPRAIRGAERIITASSAEADHIMQLCGLPAKRIHRVPLAIDPIFLRTPQVEERPPYILFVGNIEPKKGIDTLLDAFAEIADLELVIVGRAGWKCQTLLRHIQEIPGVHWLGRVERERLPGLYAGAQALVFPSTEEGFGIPLLEALAMGTPVIHRDHPVLAESANGFGHVFSSVPELIAAIQEAPRAPDAAQAWAREQTWSRWVDAVFSLIA